MTARKLRTSKIRKAENSTETLASQAISIASKKKFGCILSKYYCYIQDSTSILEHLASTSIYPLRLQSLRASSYEPGWPGWLGFRDLASPLFSLQKFRCVHMRRRAGPVTEISVFATEISVTELEIFRILPI